MKKLLGPNEEVVKRFQETSEPALAKIVEAARRLAAGSDSIGTLESPEVKPENVQSVPQSLWFRTAQVSQENSVFLKQSLHD